MQLNAPSFGDLALPCRTLPLERCCQGARFGEAIDRPNDQPLRLQRWHGVTSSRTGTCAWRPATMRTRRRESGGQRCTYHSGSQSSGTRFMLIVGRCRASGVARRAAPQVALSAQPGVAGHPMHASGARARRASARRPPTRRLRRRRGLTKAHQRAPLVRAEGILGNEDDTWQARIGYDGVVLAALVDRPPLECCRSARARAPELPRRAERILALEAAHAGCIPPTAHEPPARPPTYACCAVSS